MSTSPNASKDLEIAIEKLNFQHLNDNPTNVRFRKVSFSQIETDPDWQLRPKPSAPRKTLDVWSLIEITQDDIVAPFVVGTTTEGEEWCTSISTSHKQLFAPDLSGVITPTGSFYRLLEHNDDDPSISQTLMIVYSIRAWGYGRVVAHFPEVVF
ncbi:MAG: hypothetical protein OQK24_12735 [Magnetovibrio sp.]|nr:hypothetical protein [Magnetovibrio sp.]